MPHACPGVSGRGPIGRPIFRVRGGCRCRALGWPGVQIAGESTGQGGRAGGRTARFRCGRTGAADARKRQRRRKWPKQASGAQVAVTAEKLGGAGPSAKAAAEDRGARPKKAPLKARRSPSSAGSRRQPSRPQAPRRRRSPPARVASSPWSAAPAGSTASSPRSTRTPTPSWTSRTRSSCWSPRSCPPRPPTCGSTRRPPPSSPKYPTPEDLAAADPEEVEEILRPDRLLPGQDQVGHRAVQGPARSSFGGEVPGRLEGPGQAARRRPQDRLRRARQRLRAPRHHRGHPLRAARAALAVDRGRPTRTRSRRPIGALFPKSEWTMLSHHVIFHGRRICHARKPACGACPIAPLCPAYGEGETDPEKAKKLLKYEKGGFPGQRLKPPQAYLDAGGIPAPAAGSRRMTARRRRNSRTRPRWDARLRAERSRSPGVGPAERRGWR